MPIVKSAGLLGVEAFSVAIEATVATSGKREWRVVGLPLTAVKECVVRVRSTLAHGGWKVEDRVDVSLTPFDVRKDAAAMDLPIAVAVLAAHGIVPSAALEGVVLLGELSLDGTLRRVAGSLPVALHAKRVGARALILPANCAAEAATTISDGFDVYGAESLQDVVAFLRGDAGLSPSRYVTQSKGRSEMDLSDVAGQETAKRALEIAAAGGHNILLIGSPGSGKSLLARCLPTILPPMSDAEAIEATTIYSAAGKLDGDSLLGSRPFRAPHHDVSVAGLIGGGSVPRPGEISLAHHGVLFLDELPEFKRPTLEALRQPLEDRRVTIVRARAALTYPASFALVAAMNPCPCGYRGSALRVCTCTEDQVRRYVGRISGPLLDRLDLHVEVPHVDYRTLRAGRQGESSATVRERVIAARGVQSKRFGSGLNAEMNPRQIREHCALDAATDAHLAACVKRFALSGRAVHHILRVARTAADLAGAERLAAWHVAEAIALRPLDREVV